MIDCAVDTGFHDYLILVTDGDTIDANQNWLRHREILSKEYGNYQDKYTRSDCI
jgi:hypothetical protein